MNVLLLAVVLACGPEEKSAEASCDHSKMAAAASQSTAASPEGLVARGEKLKGLPGVKLAEVLSTPEKYDGKVVSVEAKVRRSCSRMGCWMELAAADKGPGVRVTMKDHGFAVPLDSAGRTAKVEGTVKVALLSPDKVEHFKSEGAEVVKAADGTYREVQLVADGVELRK